MEIWSSIWTILYIGGALTKVCGIIFKEASKIYYFDPSGIDLEFGDMVVVETSRGIELGKCQIEPKMVDEESIVRPLKSIIRIADNLDFDMQESNKKKAEEAWPICEQKIKEHNLKMKLVDIEYTFDGGRAIFYFTADGRVDFRELVRDLASVFKTRIELRQIGVRDESKLIKGLGPCGREVCCGKWLTEFSPVSIKMAKDQNLSLNPVKISGLCNRLMCCLNYEHEAYVQINATMPNIDDVVKTQRGKGVVLSTNILKEEIRVRLFNEEGELSEDIEYFPNSELKVISCRPNKKVSSTESYKESECDKHA